MMNSRQRFLKTLNHGSPDRVPLFREGMRSEVIRSWKRQGLKSERELSRMFRYDEREEIAPDLYAKFSSSFGENPLIELDQLRKDLDPHDRKRLPNHWKSRVHKWRNREHVLMLRVHEGFFLTMGVEGWNTFTDAIELLVDKPELVHEIMEIQGTFSAAITERILEEVEVDAAIFGEPISGAHGPLISPKMYEEMILRSYDPILDVLEKFKVQTIIFRTYANSKALLPVVLKTRINCLWVSESNIQAMDYRQIRKEFGKELKLIGGIDTDVLMQDKETIRREIETRVPPILEEGGYIPLADARIREHIPFENYLFYRQLLEKVVQV